MPAGLKVTLYRLRVGRRDTPAPCFARLRGVVKPYTLSEIGAATKFEVQVPLQEHSRMGLYRQSCEILGLMLNSGFDAPGFLDHFEQFGTHGYSLTIATAHVDFLIRVNEVAAPTTSALPGELLHRWQTANDLLIEFYRPTANLLGRVQGELPGLAALILFPLLEEVARRLSGAWDEEGILLIDLPKEVGLARATSRGTVEPKTYKRGQRIVQLAHKLFLMRRSLHPGVQRTLDRLDARMSKPRVEGTSAPLVKLCERLEYFRDMWLHGRRFEGIEAWLATIYLALVYFSLPDAEFIASGHE